MKTTEIRKAYTDFFASKGHKAVASDSLVPQNDPTLLFTGAGMNQFKDYFLGVKRDVSRATSSQKCLRTADLDEVGRTAYHHSFFEMLGNFSFGDYFKKEAISWAWEFLTEVVKLPKDRLRITVHQTDKEAFEIWEKHIGVRKDWIYACGDKSNFWPANAPEDGPNGPCGPCSEIYYDQKPELGDGGHIEDKRFAEIWNLVFTQFDRTGMNQLVPLKNKNIDTGMGLERLACMLQGKASNFDIDLFQSIHAKIKKSLGVQETPTHLRNSLNAIADHVRALTFTISDGVIPSNEGRGYVVRKILRRALWHGYQLRGNQKLKKPFLYEVIPSVVEVMSGAYPELIAAQESIQATVHGEEKRFLETLETGMSILNRHLEKLKHDEKTTLDAAVTFELYDTYGFPDELTRIICEESGIDTDAAGFDKLMEAQRKRSKGATQIAASIFTSSGLEKIPSETPATIFTGYERLNEKNVQILWFTLNDLDSSASTRSEENRRLASVILDKTPFYAESGGQVGDQGVISCEGFELVVLDTKKLDRFHIHHVEITSGAIQLGAKVSAEVDSEKRRAIMRNHTATHLLHAALRTQLGTQVRQLGSLVAIDRLRFDYAHGQSLSPEQVQELENKVNEQILLNHPIDKKEDDIQTAKESGAVAFFGEKYGDRVRIVTVPGFSKEFCGGTHCSATGDIGCFVILSDGAIASGVRRIEALTGYAAIQHMQAMRTRISNLAELVRAPVNDIELRIQKMQENLKLNDKKKASLGAGDINKMISNAQNANGINLIIQSFEATTVDNLRLIADTLRNQSENSVYLLAATDDERLQVIFGTSSKMDSKTDVRPIFKSIQPILAVRGGGRADCIQAGGVTPTNLKEKLEQAQRILVELLLQKVS